MFVYSAPLLLFLFPVYMVVLFGSPNDDSNKGPKTRECSAVSIKRVSLLSIHIEVLSEPFRWFSQRAGCHTLRMGRCCTVTIRLFDLLEGVDSCVLNLIVLLQLRRIDPFGILAEPLRSPGEAHSG